MNDNKRFLVHGGGEMAELIRSYDWSVTPLGSPATWSQSLRTTLGIILHSRFPMFLFWGPNHICFYNDAYRPSLGNDGKHPSALGSGGEKVWSDIWHIVKPHVERTMAGGESEISENELVPFYRNGRTEEIYWTYSYSPVIDDDGSIGGALVTCIETTATVLAERQVAESEQRFRSLVENTPDIITRWDLQCRLLYANASFAHRAGKPIGELLGKTNAEMGQRPETAEGFMAALRRVISTGEPTEHFSEFDTEHGVSYYFTRLVPEFDDKQQLQSVLGIARDITALRESEARFHNLIQDINVGLVVLIGNEMRVALVNESYAQMIARPVAALMNRPIFDIIPEAESFFRPVLERVYSTGEPFQLSQTPYSILDDQGNPLEGFVNLAYQPYREKGEAITGVIVVVNDVTAEVMAARSIADSQAQVRALIEESPVAACLFTGREMRVSIANKKMLDTWGKGQNAIGMPFAEALPEMKGQPFLQLLDDVFTTGVPLEGKGAEASHLVNGELVRNYYDFIYKPLRNTKGNIYGVMAVSIDVTERYLANQTVETGRKELLALFDQSPVAIATIAKENLTFRIVNSFYAELVGRTPAQLIDRPLMEALPEIAGQGFDDLLRGVLETGVAFISDNVPVELMRNGKLEKLYVNLAYQPMKNSEGEATGILVVATDVTPQAVALKQIEASEAKFRNLIMEAPFATALYVGEELIIDTANDEVIRLWGKTADVIGKPLDKALPELEGQPFLEILRDVLRTGTPYSTAEQAADLLVDGELKRIWFSFTYKPLFDEQGRAYAILNMAVDVSAQVYAREALAESEARFRGVIAAAPAGIGLFIGRDLVIESPNQTFIDIVGKGSGIVGKPLREAMPELITEGQPFLKILDDVYTTGVPFISPASLVKIVQNGVLNDNYYNISYTPLRNAAGEIYGILDIAIDVTELVAANRRVEESESRLRALLTSAPVAIGIFLGEDMMVSMPNQAFIDIVGKGPDIAGRPLGEVMPELAGEGQPFLGILQDVYRNGNTFRADAAPVLINRHGVMVTQYFNVTFSPLYDADGNIYGILDISVDVTDTVEANRRVEDNEKALASAVELAELANWRIDLVNNEVVYSDRFAGWVGVKTKQLNLNEMPSIVPEDASRIAEAFRRATGVGGSGIFDEIYTIRHIVSGQRRIIHAIGTVYFDKTGRPFAINGTAQDITIQRQSQLALEAEVRKRTEELDAAVEQLQHTNNELANSNDLLTRSNAELEQYAYVASHDLQEPLRKIRVFSSMLNEAKDLSSDNRRVLSKISSSAERMSLLIRDLLTFSRLLQAEQITGTVSLSETVQAVWNDFELVVTEKGGRLELSALPKIEAVGLQMNQLFYNLIGNALKFTTAERTPVIKISARIASTDELRKCISVPSENTTYYHIRVTDNGIGFRAEHNEQIFEVFKRLHTRDLYPGSGIGLALCRRIVANHNGCLFATSEEGVGTTFHIYLPEK